jgi:hypothetical protein
MTILKLSARLSITYSENFTTMGLTIIQSSDELVNLLEITYLQGIAESGCYRCCFVNIHLKQATMIKVNESHINFTSTFFVGLIIRSSNLID